MDERRGFFSGLIEWIVIFIIACAVMLFLRAFVVENYYVPTGSMEPTIMVGDQVLGQKVTLGLGQGVEPGQIVVFANPTPSMTSSSSA